MANGKFCAAPRDGGSARGCLRYILGYALGLKGEAQRETYFALMAEALTRQDHGAGVLWRPAVGDGTRPSAIYAHGVTSLATADLEMEAVARANTRVKTAAHHLVISFGDQDGGISDEQIATFTRTVLNKIGAGEHQYVISIHRDTDHPHAHVALGAVNPYTLRAMDRYHVNSRLAWALRETEIEMGLHHDRGLAMVREAEDGSKRVDWATWAERKSWRREEMEQRLDDLLVRAVGDYTDFQTPETWVDRVLEPKMQEVLDRARERGERADWADLHMVAARSGARFEQARGGELRVRIRERVEAGQAVPPALGDPAETSAIGDPVRAARTRDMGIALPIRAVEIVAQAGAYRSLEQAETEFAERVRTDRSYVSRQIVADGQALFGREDIDRYLADRVTDPDVVGDLSEHVERHDETLRVLSPDTQNPLYTTVAQLALAREVADLARGLADSSDTSFDRRALDDAVEAFSLARGYRPSAEQRAVLDGLQRRLIWVQGEAGSGKTTVMEVVRRYGDGVGREVVGLTTAEAAARKLSREAGFRVVNSARARVLEAQGEQIIKPGSIVVLDEVSMTSHAAVRHALTLARDRGCTVIGIGDKAQLQNIDAGSPSNVVALVARQSGTYHELTEVRRQRADWHRDLVRGMGQAIRGGDGDAVCAAVEDLGKRGVIELAPERTEAIERAAEWYVERSARHGEADVLLLAGDKMTCRDMNERIRAAHGRENVGLGFHTGGGVRKIAEGDRIVFLKNDKRLHVVNGDTGTVLDVPVSSTGVSVLVKMDKSEGLVLSFDPRRYASWDWGYALTVHKAQGASVEASAYVIDKSASAEMLHVAASRARGETRIFGSEANFADVGALAEHVAAGIRGKDDALLFDEVVARYGGPDTVWATRVKRARAQADDPLRQAHEREMCLRRERVVRESETIHERYGGDAKGVRREVAALLRKHAPESFDAWAAANKARIEHDLKRDLEREARVREPGRDHQLTLDVLGGRAQQLDESEQPEIVDEPTLETPDDAGSVPANSPDDPELDEDLEIDDEMEMGHGFGPHL